MIRCAKIQELHKIMELTSRCARQMTEEGIFQWNEHYPSTEIFKRDISRKDLHVLTGLDTIIGIISITTLMDDEYIPVRWLTENNNNVYIHRLAVNPQFQGLGYAQQLMSFAEDLAIQKKYTSIRLDTFSKNTRNQIFYEQRGYVKLQDIYFPQQSKYPFHCYELVL